jgi:hypothetical protein
MKLTALLEKVRNSSVPFSSSFLLIFFAIFFLFSIGDHVNAYKEYVDNKGGNSSQGKRVLVFCHRKLNNSAVSHQFKRVTCPMENVGFVQRASDNGQHTTPDQWGTRAKKRHK